MIGYKKIIYSISAFSGARMMIGAVSAIYIIHYGASLKDLGYIKSFQAAILLFFGFFAGTLADRFDRRLVYASSLFFAVAWLLLMCVAGHYTMLSLFYLAEALNSISLAIFQNTHNAYLIDQYQQDSGRNNLEQPLGKMNKYSFIAMAVLSMVGSCLYRYFPKGVFLGAAGVTLVILASSYVLLPSQSVSPAHKSESGLDRQAFSMILEKMLQNKYILIVVVLVSTYYQLFIQYWPVLAQDITFIVQHPLLLGVIFVASATVQSVAGHLVQKNNMTKHSMAISILSMMLSLAMLLLAVKIDSTILLLGSMTLVFFVLRIIMILVNAEIHKEIEPSIRARFDASLNTVIRVLSIGFFVMISVMVTYCEISYLFMVIGVIYGLVCLLSLVRQRRTRTMTSPGVEV